MLRLVVLVIKTNPHAFNTYPYCTIRCRRYNGEILENKRENATFPPVSFSAEALNTEVQK